jgi:hypothetical protein
MSKQNRNTNLIKGRVQAKTPYATLDFLQAFVSRQKRK